MKLAFSTLGCPEFGWSDVYSMAKDLGFQGIEVRGLGDELFERKMKVFKNWKGAVRSLVTNTCSMEEAIATLEKGKEMQAEETEEFRLLEEKIEEAHSWQTAINAALENGERGP